MDTILQLIIQVISGAAGGHGIGALLKNANLSGAVKSLAGILGGLGIGQIAGLLPALQNLMGDGGAGAVAANVGASAVGGGLLTFIVGLIKQAMNKAKAT